jgi:hypothetical protein
MSAIAVSTFVCARCGRKLRNGQYVFSTFTRQRYCYVGHCKGDKRKQRRV